MTDQARHADLPHGRRSRIHVVQRTRNRRKRALRSRCRLHPQESDTHTRPHVHALWLLHGSKTAACLSACRECAACRTAIHRTLKAAPLPPPLTAATPCCQCTRPLPSPPSNKPSSHLWRAHLTQQRAGRRTHARVAARDGVRRAVRAPRVPVRPRVRV
jgi:hypothetical protein